MTLNKNQIYIYMGVNNLTGGARGGARKKMFKPEHCSPGENDVDGSCLDDDIVIKVAKAINNMSKTDKKLDIIRLNKSPEDIHGDVCREISKISKCSSEVSWLKIKSLMQALGPAKEEFKASFKPIMPEEWVKNYNEWLSTSEIQDCLKQHMDADDKFYFYGAVPMDFNKCNVSNLCNFDMKTHLNNGKSKIGIVFNTDPSTKSGEHWISMYMDLGKHNGDNYGIYYFDSYGRQPSKEVKELIKKVLEQGLKCNRKLLYFYNDYSYQKANSQCGMYAIHFIKKMLEGLSFKEYLNTKLNDQLMIKLRNQYFVRL
jgi:hypothetical protein